MTPIGRAVFAFLASLFRSRLFLQVEIVALRHQPGVYQRSIRRPQVRPSERLVWSWLSRGWPRWREVLVFVQPATVLAWQRTRFRDHWARLSRRAPGRPAIPKELRRKVAAKGAKEEQLSRNIWGQCGASSPRRTRFPSSPG